MFNFARIAGEPLRRAARMALLCLAVLPSLAATARGDIVRMLDDNREAAQARVDLIQAAQCEINVAYFSIRDDELGYAHLAFLRDAAQRGVTVRLIIDGLNNHLPRSVQRHLIACGVQLREFHPVKCIRPFWLNRRMHDKVLVVDDCRLIVGSRNLDARNFGLRCPSYVDRDAYVCGCAAREAECNFHRLWASEDVRPVDLDGLVGRCKELGDTACPRQELDAAVSKLVGCGFIDPDGDAAWLNENAFNASVHFLYDDGGPKEEPGDISTKLLELLDHAEQSIILESPYLIFSRHLKDALTRARQRGVEVVILTNSLASTDQTLVYAEYHNQKREMMKRGVDFWEFAGPNHLHAKSILVDGYVSVIGSYNFDPRSEHLNTETSIISCDHALADALVESMAGHFARSWQIGPDGKPVGGGEKHPGADFLQLSKLRAARLVTPVIKRHL